MLEIKGGSEDSSFLMMGYAVVSFSLFLHGERKCKGIEGESVCVDYLLWYRESMLCECTVSLSSSPLLIFIFSY